MEWPELKEEYYCIIVLILTFIFLEERLSSEVASPQNPGLKFTLKLIRSDPTFAEPEQLWQIVSNYAVRDYSGTYIFKLIPCLAAEVG